MPTYQRCPDAVKELAAEIMCRFESHKPVLDARVTIDYLFAWGTKDESGNVETPAIVVNGVPALGMCRVINIRDRAKGNADAEITLDANWWDSHDPEDRAALLDHELHHIEVVEGKRDDLGRPKIRLRKHDVEVGWFRAIAARHGRHSQERIQAAHLLEEQGQYFFPEIMGSDDHARLNSQLAKLIRQGDASVRIGGETITLGQAVGALRASEARQAALRS